MTTQREWEPIITAPSGTGTVEVLYPSGAVRTRSREHNQHLPRGSHGPLDRFDVGRMKWEYPTHWKPEDA